LGLAPPHQVISYQPIPYDVRSEETFHSELKDVRNEIKIRRDSNLKDCTVIIMVKRESHLFLSALLFCSLFFTAGGVQHPMIQFFMGVPVNCGEQHMT
jgi:hypothetical protein